MPPMRTLLTLLLAGSLSLGAWAATDFEKTWSNPSLATKAQAQAARSAAVRELAAIDAHEKSQSAVCQKKIFVTSCMTDLKREVKSRRNFARSLKNRAEAKLREFEASDRLAKDARAKVEASSSAVRRAEEAAERAYEQRVKDAEERAARLAEKGEKHLKNVEDRKARHEAEMLRLIEAEKARAQERSKGPF